MVMITKGIISVSMCCSVILSLILIVLSIILFVKSNYNNVIIFDISTNHNASLIVGIEINDRCPLKDRLISNAMYQGTITGCDCWLYIKKGACREKDTLCFEISSSSEKDLLFWRSTPLCLKRYNDDKTNKPLNYISLWDNAVKQGNTCQTGLKSCGVLDTMDNIMCIDQKMNCPVSHIAIVDKAPEGGKELFQKTSDERLLLKNKIFYDSMMNRMSFSVEDDKIVGTDMSYIKLSDDKYLVFTVKDDDEKMNLLPSEFKVFEDKPCANSGEYYKEANGEYKLDNNSKYTYVNKCSELKSTSLDRLTAKENKFEYDDRYELIDTITKYKLFDDNVVLPVVERLPDYPVNNLKNINMNLYSRPYLGISKDCHASFAHPHYLNKYFNKSNSLHWLIVLLMALAFIVFLTLVVTLCNYDTLSSFLLRLLVLVILLGITYYFVTSFLLYDFDPRVYDCIDDLFAESLRKIEATTAMLFMFMNFFVYVIYVLAGVLAFILILLLIIGAKGRERLFENDEEGIDDDRDKVYHAIN